MICRGQIVWRLAIPRGDGGEKGLNWASELSTIFQMKPVVVSEVGFLLGITAFLACN